MRFRSLKTTLFGLFFISLVAFGIPIGYKLFPYVHEKESYRSALDCHKLQAKKPPRWMLEQIEEDFSNFEVSNIYPRAVEKTFEKIRKETADKEGFYHYRIIDNKLYKFVPEEKAFSSTDSPFEKALKTLLIYIQVPNIDFILCTMDGMPEPYMPKDFYLMEEDQAPILAQAKLEDKKYIILIPDQFSLQDSWKNIAHEILHANHEISWEEKKSLAVWRGGLTDIGVTNDTIVPNLASCPRFILCKKSLFYPDVIDAGFNWVDQVMEEILQKEKVCKNTLSPKEHLYYKYLPVLDGHMCTYPGYQWRLLSNSICLKQESNQVQWFYKALQPYEHYIPVANDLSDIEDKIAWAKQHDEDLQKISSQARKFAKENLLLEDNYLYLSLVLKRYAALQSGKKEIKRDTKKDPRWKCIQYRKRLSLYKSIHRIKEKLMHFL